MPRKAYYQKNKELCRAISNKSYHKNKIAIAERAVEKRPAKRDYNKEYWERQPHEKKMLKAVRNSAKSRGLKFDLTLEDIVIPEFCPILGIKLEPGTKHGRAHSPSVDRFDNTKGYIKGNVWVISYKANTMKTNATLEELRRFGEWIKTL